MTKKVKNDIRLINDVLFKYVFAKEKNSKLLLYLLNGILDLDKKNAIKAITILNPFEKEHITKKESVLDINAEDESGKKYNIEIQLLPQKSYVSRAIYYASTLYSGQLEIAKPFDDLRQTISISIIDYILLKNEKSIHNIYRFKNIDSNRELTDIIELHFIELAKYNENIPIENQSRFDRWLHLLKFGELYARGERKLSKFMKEQEGIEMIIDEIKVATSDEQLHYLIESRRKAEHDRATYIKEAKDEGLKIGEKKGKRKGKLEANIETAKKLLKLGNMKKVEIAKLLGIDIDKF